MAHPLSSLEADHEHLPVHEQTPTDDVDLIHPSLRFVAGRNVDPSDVDARDRLYQFAKNSDVTDQELTWAEDNIPGIKYTRNILEIGCSDGMQAMEDLNLRGYNVGLFTGVELKTRHVQRANFFIESNGLQNLKFIQGNAEDLPIRDNSIDVVHCWNMAYETDFYKTFSEIWRVLKFGGHVMMTSFGENNIPIMRDIEELISAHSKVGANKPPNMSKYEPPIVWPRRLPIKKLKQVMQAQGFELLHDNPVNEFIIVPGDHRHVVENALDTRKSEFWKIMPDGTLEPGMDQEDWDWFRAHFINGIINTNLRRRGYFLDVMDKWGGVFRKPESHQLQFPSFFELKPVEE